MRRRTEAKQSHSLSVLDSGHAKAAKTNNARAQQRSGVEIIERTGKRKSKIGSHDGILRVSAIHGITSKSG
jgi:hypothetical protein